MSFTGKFKYALLAIVLLSIMVVAFIFLRSRQAADQAQGRLPADTGTSLMTLASVHQTATKDGKVQWELRAVSAELEAASGHMILKTPQVDFFLEDGAKISLRADKGILDTRNNDMMVQGNVHVLSDRYTLVAETMEYRHAGRILQSQTPVHIKGETIELRSQNMTYHLESRRAQFSGRVKGSLHDALPL